MSNVSLSFACEAIFFDAKSHPWDAWSLRWSPIRLEIKTASWFSMMQHGYIYMMYIYTYLFLIIPIHIEYMYVDIWDSQKKTYSLGCGDLSCLAKTPQISYPQRSCPSDSCLPAIGHAVLEDPDQRVSLTMRMYVRPFDSSAVLRCGLRWKSNWISDSLFIH